MNEQKRKARAILAATPDPAGATEVHACLVRQRRAAVAAGEPGWVDIVDLAEIAAIV